MSTTLLADPVLTQFGAALRALYGNRLERAVLYGSRARGDARADSDYDLAVFLHDLTDRWAEMRRLGDLSLTMLDAHDALVHAMAYRAGSWRERTPLMHDIRRDGIDL